jgi:hypothetical protein
MFTSACVRSLMFGIVVVVSPIQGLTQEAVTPASALSTQPRATLASIAARSAVRSFQGTIRREMNGYILKDSTGATYSLNDQTKVREFEGQNVRLRGTLNASTGSIRVASIEPSRY